MEGSLVLLARCFTYFAPCYVGLMKIPVSKPFTRIRSMSSSRRLCPHRKVRHNNVLRCSMPHLHLEIIRAAKILHSMASAHSEAKGAVGLDGEMIDAPMLKQVKTVQSTPQGERLDSILLGRKYDQNCQKSWFRYPFFLAIGPPDCNDDSLKRANRGRDEHC